MKKAVSIAKKDIKAELHQNVINAMNTMLSKSEKDHLTAITEAVAGTGIELTDLYILNVWYDFTMGDASTTVVLRTSDAGNGHPVLGFSFNADKLMATDSRMSRDAKLLQDLVFTLDYMDRDNSVMMSVTTLAGSAGALSGVSFRGVEGYGMSLQANYDDSKDKPTLETFIQCMTAETTLPTFYTMDLLTTYATYHQAITRLEQADKRTVLPLFITIAGSGQTEADIYVTNGHVKEDHIRFTYQYHIMIVDASKKRELGSNIPSKYDALDVAATGRPITQETMLTNIMTTYPTRDEQTVYISFADAAAGAYAAQLQSCQYIRSFDNTRLVIETCQNPPAPVNLAIPAVSLVIFVGVISLFAWGTFEKRRQGKAKQAQEAYDLISEHSESEESS